jgi:hypothetical protein
MSPSEASQSRGIASQPGIYLITNRSGWVARSVCVNT